MANIYGTFCENLNSFRQRGLYCDINLYALDGENFPAHSCILAAASSKLHEKIQANDDGKLVVNADAKSLTNVLEILYTGGCSFGESDVDNVVSLCTTLELDCILDIIRATYIVPKPSCSNISITNNDRKNEPEIKQFKHKQIVADAVAEFKEATSVSSNDRQVQKSRTQILTRGQSSREKIEVLREDNCKPYSRSLPRLGDICSDITRVFEHRDSDGQHSTVPDDIQNNSAYVSHIIVTKDECDQLHVDNSLRLIEDELAVLDKSKICPVQVKVADISDEGLQASVSKTLDTVSSQLRQHLATTEKQTIINESAQIDDWKNCVYCSHFKGKKKGRFEFHTRYCYLPLKCKFCFKPFVSQSEADCHRCPLDKNTTSEPCICELCGKILANKSALKLHLKIHMNIKNYRCKLCVKSFVRKLQLDSHEKHIHKKERQFKCEICLKKFVYNYETNRHFLKHRNSSGKYDCPFCSHMVDDRISLSTHLKHCQFKPQHEIESPQYSGHKKLIKVAKGPDGILYNLPFEKTDNIITESTDRTLTEIVDCPGALVRGKIIKKNELFSNDLIKRNQIVRKTIQLHVNTGK